MGTVIQQATTPLCLIDAVKICRKCGVEKPLPDFKKHARMADGYLNQCKACANQYAHQLYVANKDRYAAYYKQFAQSPKRKSWLEQHKQCLEYKARRIEQAAAYRDRYPVKYKAKAAVTNAIAARKLQRQPCLYCGALKTDGHHPDYTKPLDVVWLCRACHVKEHHKQTEERKGTWELSQQQ